MSDVIKFKADGFGYSNDIAKDLEWHAKRNGLDCTFYKQRLEEKPWCLDREDVAEAYKGRVTLDNKGNIKRGYYDEIRQVIYELCYEQDKLLDTNKDKDESHTKGGVLLHEIYPNGSEYTGKTKFINSSENVQATINELGNCFASYYIDDYSKTSYYKSFETPNYYDDVPRKVERMQIPKSEWEQLINFINRKQK